MASEEKNSAEITLWFSKLIALSVSEPRLCNFHAGFKNGYYIYSKESICEIFFIY